MSEDKDKIAINLLIRGIKLEVTVPRSAEADYRNAQDLAEEKLNLYATRYHNRGMETYYSMAMLDLALEVVRLRGDVKADDERVRGFLDELNASLGKK